MLPRLMLLLLIPFLGDAVAQRPVVEFSHKPGLYATSTEIEITGDFDKIYYTTNGEKPYHQRRYKEPILLSEPTVLRVRAVNLEHHIDTIVTHFYGIGVNTNLPVLSICIEEEHLWSEDSGIYVEGENAWYSDSAGKYVNANFDKSWEKPAHAEYIVDGNVAFNQHCGLKLFGETTRRFAEKSMRIIARKEYGQKRFEYPVFKAKPHIDEYKHLVIRTSGNDYKHTRFKDALNSTFAHRLGVTHQAFQPVQLYINGEWWGVYNLREKFNGHFFDENYGIDDDSDSIEMFMGRWIREEGSSARRYMEMYRWFEDLDTMDDEAYQWAQSYMDIESLLNWRIIQLFINNPDARGNVRYWRVTHPDSTFKLIFYDSDHSWTYWYRNLLEKILSPEQTEWYNPEWSTMYFRRLMEHPDFRQKFLVRSAHLLNTMFHPDSLLSTVDRFHDIYDDELPREEHRLADHLRRTMLTEEEWEEEVEELREFARNRPGKMRSNIKDVMDIKSTYILRVNLSEEAIAKNEAIGRIRINGSSPVRLPFEGIYFSGVPLTIEAVSDSTNKFVSWSDGETRTELTVTAEGGEYVVNADFERIDDSPEQKRHKRTNMLEGKEEAMVENEYAAVFTAIFFAIFLGILIYGGWKDLKKQY